MEPRSSQDVLSKLTSLLSNNQNEAGLRQYWMPDDVSVECYDCTSKVRRPAASRVVVGCSKQFSHTFHVRICCCSLLRTYNVMKLLCNRNLYKY